MKPKRVKYSSTFFKSLRKFPLSQLKFLTKQEQIFKQNIFDPRLKTHKLKGELSDFYSFLISYYYRIIFHFEDKNTVVFDNVGTHKVYK